jgi:DNA repair exonuclease SbcCD nuclease subunit
MKLKGSRIGIFSDIHIGLGQDSMSWHTNILNFAEWVADVYNKKGINEILIPGDIFHNRNEISVNTLSTAKKFFDILSDFKIFISTGNHDCYYKERSDVNSISLFDGWNNITVIDKIPHIFEVVQSTKKLCMVPWGTDINSIPDNIDYCVGHFEIKSFKMNNHAVCDHGMTSTELLNKSKYVITGHFHKKTHRVYESGEILYLGSPYQQNFGDVDEERGVYIFNLEDGTFEFIENTISPKHIKLSLAKILSKELPSNYIKQNVSGNMVCLMIDVGISPEEISLISNKLQKLNPQFFRLDYKVPDKELNLSDNGSSYDSIDVSKNISDFVSALDINFKDETLKYLQELYTKLTA